MIRFSGEKICPGEAFPTPSGGSGLPHPPLGHARSLPFLGTWGLLVIGHSAYAFCLLIIIKMRDFRERWCLGRT